MCDVVVCCCRDPGTSGAQPAMVWKHKSDWTEGSSNFPGRDGQSDEGSLQGETHLVHCLWHNAHHLTIHSVNISLIIILLLSQYYRKPWNGLSLYFVATVAEWKGCEANAKAIYCTEGEQLWVHSLLPVNLTCFICKTTYPGAADYNTILLISSLGKILLCAMELSKI